MNNLAEALTVADLSPEWERVEVLARCLLAARGGRSPDEKLIQRLRQLQLQVQHLRERPDCPWLQLPIGDLPPLAVDILAVIYGAEAQPRVGMLIQDLQANGQPFPSLALVQVLLALDDAESDNLQRLACSHGPLQQRGLIAGEDNHVFASVRADRAWLGTLLCWPAGEMTPPGSFRVQQAAVWDDLVLPEDRLGMLREFMMWLRYRSTVVDEWGGRKTGGPVALFSGPSGTGKTFAASVIANELGWPLYRVDLARLVSKYIGETEKNIGRLFDAAHGKPMVLQFDEVDALMGKRGEIKEARDRYANMEVSYLLSRIEEHEGPCVLTTNLRNQIDKAFVRRFQIVVEFPRPDENARAQLWDRMLPPRAPRHAEVDCAFLGKAVSITGANIRNSALHAAYLAAHESSTTKTPVAIQLKHIALGVWRELSKDKAQVPKADLGALLAYLPDELLIQESST